MRRSKAAARRGAANPSGAAGAGGRPSYEHVPYPVRAEVHFQPAGIETHVESSGIRVHAEIDQLQRRSALSTVGENESAHLQRSSGDGRGRRRWPRRVPATAEASRQRGAERVIRQAGRDVRPTGEAADRRHGMTSMPDRGSRAATTLTSKLRTFLKIRRATPPVKSSPYECRETPSRLALPLVAHRSSTITTLLCTNT